MLYAYSVLLCCVCGKERKNIFLCIKNLYIMASYHPYDPLTRIASDIRIPVLYFF